MNSRYPVPPGRHAEHAKGRMFLFAAFFLPERRFSVVQGWPALRWI